MNCLALLVVFLGPSWVAAAEPAEAERPATTLIVVVGAAGEPSYGKIFADELAVWRKTAATGGARLHVIGDPAAPPAADETDKQQLQALLAKESADPAAAAPLWLVFIGHGTFDGRTAALNLRGPDLTSTECAEWLKPLTRPTAVIDTTAASAPFLTALSAPGRVVVTATKSGQQRNYARFGRYFAQRAIDPAADLDKDDQTSLFEAFLAAARDTADFYRREGRIATEHPLLDDDGDGQGVRHDFFEQGRLVRTPAAGKAADGALARTLTLHPSRAERRLSPERLQQRDELEAALAALRNRKADLSEAEYLTELERVLAPLARLYAE